jgi:hypothetical protein
VSALIQVYCTLIFAAIVSAGFLVLCLFRSALLSHWRWLQACWINRVRPRLPEPRLSAFLPDDVGKTPSSPPQAKTQAAELGVCVCVCVCVCVRRHACVLYSSPLVLAFHMGAHSSLWPRRSRRLRRPPAPTPCTPCTPCTPFALCSPGAHLGFPECDAFKEAAAEHTDPAGAASVYMCVRLPPCLPSCLSLCLPACLLVY